MAAQHIVLLAVLAVCAGGNRQNAGDFVQWVEKQLLWSIAPRERLF